jgi:hypothetical protein
MEILVEDEGEDYGIVVFKPGRGDYFEVSAFEERGAVVLGVSPDSGDGVVLVGEEREGEPVLLAELHVPLHGFGGGGVSLRVPLFSHEAKSLIELLEPIAARKEQA